MKALARTRIVFIYDKRALIEAPLCDCTRIRVCVCRCCVFNGRFFVGYVPNGNYVRSLAFLIEAVANRKVAMDATAMFVGQSENITSVSSRRVTRTSQTYEGNFN